MKKILFAASECVPFVKTGDLAEVCGTLPAILDPKEFDVRVVLPNYSCIPDEYRNQFLYVTHFYMGMGPYNPPKYVGVLSYEYQGITYYFIDNEEYFTGDSPYGDVSFDIVRFCFFDKAVLSMLPLIDFQPDLIHCHDWQTGLIPVYLRTEFQGDMFFWGIRGVMTIHNLQFQGVCDLQTMMELTGLPGDLFTTDKLEYYGDASMLKGGIVYADYITTVSETYAEEIQTPFYGEGLDGLLSARHFDIQGILNGIDYDRYNPAADRCLFQNYDVDTFRQMKGSNKDCLQEMLGLTKDCHKFLIGLVTCLLDQKGLDLISICFDRIMDENTQFVILGTGQENYENMFRRLAGEYPDQISANICYNEDLAHKLFAAADAVLMPSLFEPCGLTQMISFRYGTVPIVRETGGLKDTVQPYNEHDNCGNGFAFSDYNADDMLSAINCAKRIFFEKKRQWNQIIERGMVEDFSWNVSARKYQNLYNYLLGN